MKLSTATARLGPGVPSPGHGWLLALAVVLTAALGLYRLGTQSIWLDEAESIRIARSWPVMWELMFHREANMWLYYLGLHFWLPLGRSEFMVRLPSVVLATATIPLVYLLGRRLFGSRVGLIASVLLAVNPYFIRYAQEARSYSLLVLLVTLSSYILVKLILDDRAPLSLWCGYVVVGAFSVYAHMFGALALATHGLTVLLLPRRTLPWKRLTVSYSAIAVLVLPIFLSPAFTDGQGGLGWISRPGAVDLYRTLKTLAGSAPALVLGYVPLCLVALISMRRYFLRPGSHLTWWRFAFPLVSLVIPLLAVFVLSRLVKPMLLPRYVIFCLVPFVILVALGFAQVRRRWLAVAFMGVLLLSSSRSLFTWYTQPDKEEWRQVAALVLAEATPDDVVLSHGYSGTKPFQYYIDRLQAPRADRHPAQGASAGGPGSVSQLVGADQKLLDALPDKYTRVWLVLSLDHGPADQERLIRESLGRTYRVMHEHRFHGVRVVLYDRTSRREVARESS